jgi:ATP-dependent Clp protease protease subunit
LWYQLAFRPQLEEKMKRIYEIDPKIKIKTISDLLEVPVVIRVVEFEEKDAKDFADQMNRAHNTGQPIVPIVIDSYGGQVYGLLSMIAEIKASKIPVATICMGKAMSCGAVLLTCGAEGMRFMDEESTVMIHDVSSMHFGKNEELKASAKQTDKLQRQIFEMMAKNCGHKANYFLKAIHERAHAEWYLDAKAAKKHNIVNHIRVPNFKVSVKLDIAVE